MEIEIDIDNIIMSCSRLEKVKLYKALLEENDVLIEKERIEEQITANFRALEAMSKYELKKTLCNLLGVGCYTDEAALREKLEEIIKA